MSECGKPHVRPTGTRSATTISMPSPRNNQAQSLGSATGLPHGFALPSSQRRPRPNRLLVRQPSCDATSRRSFDEEVLESRRSAKQASLDMMRDHLAEFKRANGQQATFKGWIAMLHPENVMLDHGLDLSDNRWLAMWNEAQTAHEPEPASSVDPSLDIDPSDDRRDMYV